MMAASFATLRRAEKELRISQTFLNNIIDCSPNSLWIADERGYAIRTNQALRDNFHARDENMLGKYGILNDNVVEKRGFMPLARDVFEKGIAAHFVIQYDTAEVDGISFDRPASMYLDVKISPIRDQHGKVTNAIIQHTDLTERRRIEEELRRSEDRYRQLAENFPETIFEADMTGKVTYANRHGIEWFGICEADIEHGVNILEFVAPQDREKVQ
jgi:PAS domain-containing protein